MSDLYIGLMSGTSMDGVAAALVRFGDRSLDVIATHQHDYPGPLRHALVAARSLPNLRRSEQVPDLHRLVGECFRDAALALLASAGVDAASVRAIGSHGQTLRHAPDAAEPYSLQIGDPDLIAAGTGIATIADFRRDNREAICTVCLEFIELCRELQLFSGVLVAIDGSKFKAVNSRDQNFTKAKMKRRLQQIDESIERYLGQIASADRQCRSPGSGDR